MTKEEWKSLTKKQQWDCIVALRGPDIKRSEVIKVFTTGVIRQEMSNLMRVGGQLSNLGFVVIPSDGPVFKGSSEKFENGVLRPDLDHFAQHTWEAAEILGIPIVHVPPTIWENMVLSSNDHNARIVLLNWVKGNSGQFGKVFYKKHFEGLLNSYKPYLDKEVSDEG